jgi:hypothetical protein
MTPLAQAVACLIEKNQSPLHGECPIPTVLELLRAVEDGLKAGDPANLEEAIFRLRDHWLNAVAWCSDLSRDIEKILILYDESKPGDSFSSL